MGIRCYWPCRETGGLPDGRRPRRTGRHIGEYLNADVSVGFSERLHGFLNKVLSGSGAPWAKRPGSL